MRLRTAATALVAATLTPFVLTVPAAHAATAAAPYDFNGDGRADLAIGAPGATVAGKAKAGAVSVVHSGTGGPKTSTRTLLTQNTAGIPGSAEADDAFGTSVTSADLDRDGYADLVVGTPGEDTSDDTNDGVATIVWGSASGLSGARTVHNFAHSSHDRYGLSLAAGDFDADGHPDIAVGATGSTLLTVVPGPITRSGAWPAGGSSHGLSGYTGSHGVPHLSSGDVTGEGFDSLVVHGRWSGGDTATQLADARVDNFGDWMDYLPPGQVSAVGDIDGDGHADIAVGNDREPSADAYGALGGRVTIVYGGPEGRDGNRPEVVLTQDTAGVPGASEAGDRFGSGLALGDVDGDGYADLAVGAAGENGGAGSVTVLYGSASGLTTKGSASFTQSTAGVPGTSEQGDLFGARVVLTDHTGDHRADLSLSAPGENSGDGSVWSLRGTATGPTTTGATSFGPAATGVSTTGSPRFGTALGG
ncbi:FG-GAP repeat domain-containing protein [Streptomyces sp. enrichment culture]|uniref:FG-GAP repeat domain-containing protein n=1 Tax=Streptomyces sp. enrichment culture TaxID=1795815 RepID=UPI003F5595DA